MNRRTFLRGLPIATSAAALFPQGAWAALRQKPAGVPQIPVDPSLARDWLKKWEQSILQSSRKRYCDRELGEEIGWLMTPFMEGFYYGYQATREIKWINHLAEWADAWFKRGVKEPDGYLGWPKATGGFLADSLLGEAMALRPLVLMAGEVRAAPALMKRFGRRADEWLATAEKVFEKWNSRGAWRELEQGGLWVVPAFGIDEKSGNWTAGYDRRATEGFSNPANKQNHIARWLLAMHEVTGKPLYRERAEKWFIRMKSVLRTREEGKYLVWNYWDPAGPWDYKPGGAPRHWVGVHPKGGYYAIDVSGMVAAFEHGLVFTREDIDKLIATNRDFMWNQSVEEAKFQRIDGGAPDERWKNSAGTLWTSLVPYDATLRKIFLANHDPTSWGGLATTPWFLALRAKA